MNGTQIILFLSLALCFNISVAKAKCSCEKFSSVRFLAGSDPVTILEDKPFSKIQGVAADVFGKPPSNAYIYLFRKPSNIADKNFSVSDLADEKSLFACETGTDGEFCFENIPRGKYVICANTPYNSSFITRTTCVLINLKPEKRRVNRKLKITLEAAD